MPLVAQVRLVVLEPPPADAIPGVAAKAPAASSGKPRITSEERLALISKGAYHISMKRNPCDGDMEGDWVAAEAVIDMLFESD